MLQYESKIIKSILGKEMTAGLGFMVQAIFGIMGSKSSLHLGALRLSEWSLVLKAECGQGGSCGL